jgi:hexokinase
VVAVLNDTTGTMLACSFLEKHCYIGAIIGTGLCGLWNALAF